MASRIRHDARRENDCGLAHLFFLIRLLVKPRLHSRSKFCRNTLLNEQKNTSRGSSRHLSKSRGDWGAIKKFWATFGNDFSVQLSSFGSSLNRIGFWQYFSHTGTLLRFAKDYLRSILDILQSHFLLHPLQTLNSGRIPETKLWRTKTTFICPPMRNMRPPIPRYGF